MNSENLNRKSNALTQIILLLFCCLLLTEQSGATGPMLPRVYREQADISGWLMSEKLDGVRGYWDGKRLLSKNGKILFPPPEFTAQLPEFALEGELWGGRGTFEQTASIVTRLQPHDGWLQLKFAIFDVPHTSGSFVTRIAKASTWFTSHPSDYAFVISQIAVQDQTELQLELKRIETLDGEGLIVRNPEALYRAGRSSEVLKVKNYQDDEATVVAHLTGKGRNAERLGALLVRLDDGTQFKIGSGFSDIERENPPEIGALISFKFYGNYQSGIPKFPSFIRIRQDKGL